MSSAGAADLGDGVHASLQVPGAPLSLPHQGPLPLHPPAQLLQPGLQPLRRLQAHGVMLSVPACMYPDRPWNKGEGRTACLLNDMSGTASDVLPHMVDKCCGLQWMMSIMTV